MRLRVACSASMGAINDGPRIHENHFDVEQDEQHRDEVKFHRETSRCRRRWGLCRIRRRNLWPCWIWRICRAGRRRAACRPRSRRWRRAEIKSECIALTVMVANCPCGRIYDEQLIISIRKPRNQENRSKPALPFHFNALISVAFFIPVLRHSLFIFPHPEISPSRRRTGRNLSGCGWKPIAVHERPARSPRSRRHFPDRP